MPQAAAHILIPLIIVSLIRDRYIKKKKKNNFPLHYVLVAGLGGIIPDLDIVVFWVLSFFGFTLEQVHRTFAHTIFVPLIFIVLAISKSPCVLLRTKVRSLFGLLDTRSVPRTKVRGLSNTSTSTPTTKISELGKHKLKLHVLFWMLAFGSFFHLFLDATLQGFITPLYPFSSFSIGLDLFGYFPEELERIAAPSLDAGLLIVWIIYLELKHKISDFI